MPSRKDLKRFSEPFREKPFELRIFFDTANCVANFYSVFEAEDGTHHLAAVGTSSGGIVVLPDTEEFERFFR